MKNLKIGLHCQYFPINLVEILQQLLSTETLKLEDFCTLLQRQILHNWQIFEYYVHFFKKLGFTPRNSWKTTMRNGVVRKRKAQRSRAYLLGSWLEKKKRWNVPNKLRLKAI